VGGFGKVYLGEYKGISVAIKKVKKIVSFMSSFL